MKCKNCLLPDAVPGANIDAQGVCAYCRQRRTVDLESEEQQRVERQRDLELALDSCRGEGEYDCIVMLSGGKDSCYLLHKIKHDYGLNALAFTVNIHVPDIAWKNIHQTVARLEVPHITYTPPKQLYRRLFRFLLQNQNARGAVRTVCYVCAPLTEGYALKLAVEKNIPLILAGYSPGQPDPDRMVYEFPKAMITETDWIPQEIRGSGQFSKADLQLFWNPANYPADTRFPRYLAPFHAWRYNQTEVMKTVVELGLVRNTRHASPILSNCPVNWLLMYSDLKNLGYNSYAPEFAALIREKKASRRYWRLLGPLVDFMIRKQILLGKHVKKALKWLDLNPSDLRITRGEPDINNVCPSEDRCQLEEMNDAEIRDLEEVCADEPQ
ncbi:MAG: hypothetical protein JW888_03065 [Pirellulales bacterium]|nr:hypothetical protein [Pirellulales bacterium]